MLRGLPTPANRNPNLLRNKKKELRLYITSIGHNSFMVTGHIQGQDKRVVFGPFPKCTIERARKAIQDGKGKRAIGEEKRRFFGEKTFGAVFELFMEKDAKIRDNPRTQ
jgi:hypothetical protein